MPRYADIVLPLAQPAYTFSVPEGMALGAGEAVGVPVGGRQIFNGRCGGGAGTPPVSGGGQTAPGEI